MPLSVTCGCGHQFRVEEQFAGQEGPCPVCGQTTKLEGRKVPPFDVFLSYSSKDKTIADAAVAVLEQRGLRCWVAPRNIVAGKEWGESIIEGLESSGLMVLVFSQHSNQSQQVIREVERAVAKGIPIIPFRIEDIPTSKAMEYFISCHHWLDAIDPPLEQHLSKLADMAGHLLGSAPPPRTDAGAEGLAGKLTAAANTLLARDRRLQALLGVAAIVVLAASIAVAAALMRGRDPVASSELIAAKAQAEVLARQVQALDPGQGFGERISAVDRELNAASALFADKQFDKAQAAYAKVLEEGQRVAELAAVRKQAANKRTAMESARMAAQAAHADEFAKNDWDQALSHANQAADGFAMGDFARAAEHWNSAAAAYSSAAEAAKKSGLPRTKALALWTSMAVNNKWWFETLRPKQAQAPPNQGLGGFDPAPGFLPGVRPNFGGFPEAPQLDDWPPYAATVRKGTVFLDLQAREGLGLDEALIDRLIQAEDLGLLDATATKVVEQLASRHGKEVDWAYRLGTNVAKLKVLCDLGSLTARPFSGAGGLQPPARGDVIWSSDYVMHRATVNGCPQDLIDTVKEVRLLFDENSDGLRDGDYALTFAYPQMKEKYDAIYEKYFSSVEATTAMFAAAKPPANPPEFPSRSEEDNQRITRLEKANAWILFDIERFDRPPISIVFEFGGGYGPFQPEPDPLVADVVQFPLLRRLSLRALEITDKHLEKLPQLAHLRELWLGSEAITPAGMAQVAKIPQLEELWLYDDTKAPDEELAPLAACKKLKTLGLLSPNLTDSAAETLSRIPTLETLRMRETQITDKGIEHLSKLANLKTLDLQQAKITDKSAPHLAKLTKLEELNLGETGLTDKSLPELKKLKGLKTLYVSNTKITSQGTSELKQALPNCEVSGN